MVLALRPRERRGVRRVRVPPPLDRPPDGDRIRGLASPRGEPPRSRGRPGRRGAVHRRSVAIPGRGGRPAGLVEGDARGVVGVPHRELGDLRTRACAGLGWWKVLPAMVAGLGFGYLFLRHGIGAAILAHFVNDYAAALSYEGFGGEAFLILLNLLFLGLAIAGAGFFAWYAIVAWRHFRGLIERFWPPTRAAATPGPAAPYFSAMPQPFATPPASVQPPPPGQPPPPTQVWSMTPSAGPPTVAVRNPSRIPREYTPSYVPPPYGYPPVRFQCPYCAWVEAKYDAGRFTCTRCGRTA